MSTARLIIVAGLPGSGKTTVAKELEIAYGGMRFSADEWMLRVGFNLHDEECRAKVERLQWDVAQQMLALGQVVLIEWGTWGRTERDALREAARALGAAVELRFLSAPLAELFRRIQQRGMENPPIPWHVVQGWGDRIEPPDAEELALYDPPML